MKKLQVDLRLARGTPKDLEEMEGCKRVVVQLISICTSKK